MNAQLTAPKQLTSFDELRGTLMILEYGIQQKLKVAREALTECENMATQVGELRKRLETLEGGAS